MADSYVECGERKRESRWTESIATGSKEFTENIISQPGKRIKGRKAIKEGQVFQVREESKPYNSVFDAEKGDIGFGNRYIWISNTDLVNV